MIGEVVYRTIILVGTIALLEAGIYTVRTLIAHFKEDCRSRGLKKAALSWGWEAAFFPLIIYAAQHSAGWTFGAVAFWLAVTTILSGK